MYCTKKTFVGPVAQSVWRLGTGWTVRGSNPGGRRDFPHLSRPALGPTQLPVQWVPGLSPGVKSGRGVALTPYPLLVLWSRKGRAIPLLPLRAMRPVQSLSACTRVTFTFFYQKRLTFRRLMSYIYGAPILDVSRSHTTTQHSR